jgi:hypothetical protein
MKRSLAILLLFMTCFLLSIDCTLYHVREMTKEYGKEEKIYTFISKISFKDLLVDEQKNELEPITNIKNQLVRVGLSMEVVDSILDTEVIGRKISHVLAQEINTFLFDDKKSSLSFSSDAILAFSKENMNKIVTELQEKKIPKSELLTEEKQKEILIKMEVVALEIEEEIKKVIPILEKKVKESEQYPKLEKRKTELYRIVQGSRFLYSQTFSVFLLITAILCIGILFLLCHSPYRYLKFFGLSCFINAVFFFCCIVVLTKIRTSIGTLPPFLLDFGSSVFLDLKNSFQNLLFFYLILFFIFLALNIIIHKILDGQVEKKLNNI